MFAVLVAASTSLLAKASTAKPPLPCSLESVSGGWRQGELRVTFMGVSTLLFDDGETQILIDGFFSRPSLIASAIGRIGPNEARINQALKCAGIGSRLAAIFVAHAHVDHVLDAPYIARHRPWVRLVGSRSVANVALGNGVSANSIEIAKDKASYRFGSFNVTTLSSKHGRPILFSGSISQPLRFPAWAPKLRSGENFSFFVEHGGRRFLVHPSANYTRGWLEGRKADVVFLGIAQIGKKSDEYINAYWAELAEASGAHVVVPIHWDNFGRPLSYDMRPMPRTFDRIDRARKKITALAGQTVRLIDLPPFKPTDISEWPPLID